MNWGWRSPCASGQKFFELSHHAFGGADARGEELQGLTQRQLQAPDPPARRPEIERRLTDASIGPSGEQHAERFLAAIQREPRRFDQHFVSRQLLLRAQLVQQHAGAGGLLRACVVECALPRRVRARWFLTTRRRAITPEMRPRSPAPLTAKSRQPKSAMSRTSRACQRRRPLRRRK
jgi:hypothetical protein